MSTPANAASGTRIGPALGRALRANLVPGLVAQAVAVALVVAWFASDAAQAAFVQVGEWKTAGGFLFAGMSTALFGGLLPYLVLLATGAVPRAERLRQGVFFVIFFGLKGVEVDGLYRLQSWAFGDGSGVATIASKVAVDQFVYNPLWAAPLGVVALRWNAAGLRRSRLGHCFRGLMPVALPTMLMATWVVWIPTVSIVYCLPPPLQHPLFNVVLFFFVLVANLVARGTSGDPAPPAVTVPESPSQPPG